MTMRRRLPSALAAVTALATISVAGCDGSEPAGAPANDSASVASGQPDDVTTAPATTAVALPTQADLDDALALLGIDASGAPREAVVLADAVFCGWEDNGLSGTADRDPDGQQCFLDAHGAGAAALFVQQRLSNEGDPLAWISRTDGTEVTYYIDTTRDCCGAKQWRAVPCGQMKPLDPYRDDATEQFYTCDGQDPWRP